MNLLSARNRRNLTKFGLVAMALIGATLVVTDLLPKATQSNQIPNGQLIWLKPQTTMLTVSDEFGEPGKTIEVYQDQSTISQNKENRPIVVVMPTQMPEQIVEKWREDVAAHICRVNKTDLIFTNPIQCVER